MKLHSRFDCAPGAKLVCLFCVLLAGCSDLSIKDPIAPQIVWATPGPITYGSALSTAQLNASSSVAGTFTYSPALGTLLSAGTQTLSVTFTPTDGKDLSTETASVLLTVNRAVPVLNWATPAAISYGTVLTAAQLNATAAIPGTFSYTPAVGTMLDAGTQIISVTFTPEDTEDYNTATSHVPLTVNQAVSVLTWATPAAIVYGTTLSATQLDATASVPGTFSYTPALGALLTAGPQTLSVMFTPADTRDYSTTTANVALTVNEAIPVLSWAAPAAISYGTALSAAQLNATASVPGTFAYTPALGALLTAGSQALSVTFTPADSKDFSTASASVPLTVIQAVPVLSWATPAAIAYGTVLSAAQLNATANAPGAFTYSPALGTLFPAGSQTLSVTFDPVDTKDYTAATASVTLTVNKAVPVITWGAPAAMNYGATLSAAQLNAMANTPGTFGYTPALGAMPGVGTQILTVTFTPADNKDYTTATASVPLTVNQAVPVLSWATPAAIGYGTALSAAQLNATASVQGTFAYTPALGALLTAGSQALSVTFTPADSKDFSTASASVPLTVNQAAPVMGWATPAGISYGTALSAAQLNATANVPGTFTYTPALGAVLTAASQTLSVTFAPADAKDYTSANASVLLTVSKAVPVPTWATPAAISYGTGLSAAQLNATASVPGTFTYTPALGALLTAGSQALSLTFTPADSKDYTATTASVLLTVNQAVPVLSWATPAAIGYGTVLSAAQLNATAVVPGTFTYTPALGALLAAGSQALSVTFTPADSKDFSTASASVSLTVNQAVPVLSWATPAAIGYGTVLSAAQLNATAVVPGTFTYTPALGALLAAGSQALSVTFTPADSKDFSTASASVSLTVNQAVPVLSWATPAAIGYGTALSAAQLNATAVVPGTFTYTPALGALLTAGSQALSVTFTPADSKDFSTASGGVPLTVNQAVPLLNWATPTAISYGAALSAAQLDATANVPGTFTYTPALGAVLTAASQTLSVTFAPADTKDYTSANSSVLLTVSKAVPVLSWATPPAISYGTGLSATQLNATASVPGTFSYTPTFGSVPGAGSETLSVTFSPTDATDYFGAAASTTLLVNQAIPVLNWNPGAIGVNMPLSSLQLNSAAVAPGSSTALPGIYVYEPGAGATFGSSGPETLSVTFTPADTADYTTAETGVSIDVAPFGVVCWGDSLTAGNEGVANTGAYPTELEGIIVLPVVNEGVGGQTSTQIGVRQGGVQTDVTVAGGVIPSSGGVSITFPAGYEPASFQGPSSGVYGTILGVHGLVTIAYPSGIFTFTPTALGSPVSATGTPKFVVDTPYASYLPIFWEGTNNVNPPVSDLANQVATVPPGQDYLVLARFQLNAPGYWIGGSGYGYMMGINNQLANTFGSHYMDIRKLLVNSYNPALVTDVSDYNHDEEPTSLRAFLGSGTLGSSIGPADTSFTVNLSIGNLEAGAILTIDTGTNAENVLISSVSGNTVVVVRNYGGNDTSHSAGVAVTQSDSIHLNAQGYQIVANAVAGYLSAYAKPAAVRNAQPRPNH